MPKWLAICFVVVLAGCSAFGALIPTPGVVANVQAAQTATQTVGQTNNTTRQITRPRARSEISDSQVRVDEAQVINNTTVEMPMWTVIALAVLSALAVLGWIDNIARGIRSLFRRRSHG